MRYRSFAEWPTDVYTAADGSHVSTDDHDSQEFAEGVCFLLRQHGFCGKGPKPLRTWVEPIVDPHP